MRAPILALPCLFASLLFAGESGIPGVPTDKPLEKSFRLLDGLAIDSADNIYLSDLSLNQVFKLTPDGKLFVVAGTGKNGSAGDGGKAVDAELNSPGALAIDKAGNLFIACNQEARIRKVNKQGTITTFAGNGKHGMPEDGALATMSPLYLSGGMCFDSKGVLYVTARFKNCVYRITPIGIIQHVAGIGEFALPDGSRGDGGKAVNAAVGHPSGVAVDSRGTIYISENGWGEKWPRELIRVIDPQSGVIRTLAGTGARGYGGDGGPAHKAMFYSPQGLMVDRKDALYIADQSNHCIRRIDKNGTIECVAGTPGKFSGMYIGDGVKVSECALFPPGATALNSKGQLFILCSSMLLTIDEKNCVQRLAGKR